MKKVKNFKLVWQYLKKDKVKLFTYIFLVFVTYVPVLFSAFLWAKALELLLLKNLQGFFIYLLLWELSYILFYSLLQVPREYLYNYLEIKFMKEVSKDLYHKMDNLPARAFEEFGVGELINRLYTDPDRVIELLSSLIKMICKSFVVIIVLYIAFKVSIILGFEIVAFGVIMGFISYKFFPKIKKTQEEIKKQSDSYVKVATENMTGIREIKALGIKRNIENNISKIILNLVTNTKKIKVYEILYHNINNFIYFALQFVILFTSGYLFIQGKIEYSVFILLQMYLWRIDEVVESISDFGVNYNKVSVSLKRIDEIINNKLYSDEHFGEEEINSKGLIKFEDVKFRYTDIEENTLNGLNLSIEPNKKIAIVGKSGNGKSTIFNLLLRYFDATEGKILIDDVDIKDLTEESLRKNISIIRQSPFLFNMSIFDNFKLVKDDVTLDEIKLVCKRANIDEYIESLPSTYETIIGEGGINLSGGQKQRLAIARTLLLNTKIILFDEATSALDNESQAYIKKTIDDLVKDHTIIIVAHRLSTIIDADVIHIIEKGSLLTSGTHKELLENCETYSNLYKTEM